MNIFLIMLFAFAVLASTLSFLLYLFNKEDARWRAARDAQWREGVRCSSCGLVSSSRFLFSPCPECGEKDSTNVVFRVINDKVEIK